MSEPTDLRRAGAPGALRPVASAGRATGVPDRRAAVQGGRRCGAGWLGVAADAGALLALDVAIVALERARPGTAHAPGHVVGQMRQGRGGRSAATCPGAEDALLAQRCVRILAVTRRAWWPESQQQPLGPSVHGQPDIAGWRFAA